MAIKRLSFIRTTKFTIEYLAEDEVQSILWKYLSKKNQSTESTITKRVVESAQFLSLDQYRRLVGKKPCISKQIRVARILWDAIVENKIFLVSKSKKVNLFKILHIYINNENILKIQERFWAKYTEMFFDEEGVHNIENIFSVKRLKPDGFVHKNNQFHFVETDLWKESLKFLKKKGDYYLKYFQQENEQWNMEYNQVKIYFFTSSRKRIENIQNRRIFRGLELLNMIEYSLCI